MSIVVLLLLVLLLCSSACTQQLARSVSDDGWWPCSSSPPRGALPRRRHNISLADFGAIGDGKFINTPAFEDAIHYLDSLAEDGGAQLVVPPGNWVTGSFRLISHVTLFLEEGAIILGSQDPGHWPVIPPLPSYGRGRELPGGRHSSLLLGDSLTDVVITGANGTIDGQALIWWELFRNKSLDFTRGHLIEFINSTNIIVSNITLKNSPFWTLHPVYCSNVLVRDLTILAPPYSPNVDGIDPDSSSSVCIEDCYMSIGDDLISIKSGWDEYGIRYGRPSSKVHIQRVRGETPTSAGVAIGSEMSGGISDVLIQSMFISNSRSGFRLKTGPGRGGYVTNISVQGMNIRNVSLAFDFVGDYGGHPDNGFDPEAYPSVRGISVADVVGEFVGWAGSVRGEDNAPFRDLCFSNVSIQTLHGGWNCSFAHGFASSVYPPVCPQLSGAASDEALCYTRSLEDTLSQ